MTITCPHCGFTRETERSRIPAGGTQVTCPRCKGTFPLADPEPPKSPATAGSLPAQGSPPGVPDPAALPKAGFWIRLVGFLIDSILTGIVQFILSFGLGLALNAATELDPGVIETVLRIFSAAVVVTYYVFFTGFGGQTPGKMVTRIKVIGTDGSEIGYGQAALREVVGKFLSGILFMIGYLMVAFDRQKQGLHDKIASTYVIKL